MQKSEIGMRCVRYRFITLQSSMIGPKEILKQPKVAMLYNCKFEFLVNAWQFVSKKIFFYEKFFVTCDFSTSVCLRCPISIVIALLLQNRLFDCNNLSALLLKS